MTWQGGRQLAGMTDGTHTLSFGYNEGGLRTSKTFDNVTRNYVWNSSQLLVDRGVDDTFYFHYNANGEMIGYTWKTASGETECFLVKNQQGDVEKVISSSGAVLAAYTYDAWGNILSATGSLANANPIRYRGYYFDTETGLYYLHSRYYDPNTGRFINADDVGMLGADGDLQSYNLFAYCGNNPVTGFDPNGEWNWKGVAAGAILFTAGAITVAASIASCGAATPLAAVAMTTVISATAKFLTGCAIAATGMNIAATAATDGVAVIDLSTSVFGNKGGESVVINFKNSTGEIYSHGGHTSSYDLGVSYSTGIVSGYNKLGDYGGEFYEGAFSIPGMGMSICSDSLNPKSSKVSASSVSISASLSPGGAASYDYYVPVFAWKF